jgi:hypothetical protein
LPFHFAHAEGRIRLPANRAFPVKVAFGIVTIPEGNTFVVGLSKSKIKGVFITRITFADIVHELIIINSRLITYYGSGTQSQS